MNRTRNASNSKDLRVLNRMLVLDTIRHNGLIARHEVAKATGLAAPTVTVIVNDLIKWNIVHEVGHGESNGGRRPVMLELNSRAAYLFVTRIQRGEILTAMMDLAGNSLKMQRQALDTTSPEEVVAVIGSSFDRMVADPDIAREKVLWCGVASPGLVNSFAGIVERSSNLRWGKIQLAKLLSQRLDGIPVRIENISNAAALGEKTFGAGYSCPNLIFLNLSVGIGAGIILNGELFGGARGYAGEIGSARIASLPEPDITDSSAKYVTFEEKCGVRAIVEQIKAQVPETVFVDCGISKERVGVEDIFRPPLLEVPEIQSIISEASCLVGMKVAELISLFNTEMIILGGELTRAGNLLLDTVIATVAANTLKEMRESVKISISSMREDPALMGAYALVLEQLFHSETWIGNET